MELTLENITVLSNIPEWYTPKSEIVKNCLSMRGFQPMNQVVARWNVDVLVEMRLVDQKQGQYKINGDGIFALKSAVTDLKDITAQIETLIRAKD